MHLPVFACAAEEYLRSRGTLASDRHVLTRFVIYTGTYGGTQVSYSHVVRAGGKEVFVSCTRPRSNFAQEMTVDDGLRGPATKRSCSVKCTECAGHMAAGGPL
jgi:hypothetical protein